MVSLFLYIYLKIVFYGLTKQLNTKKLSIYIFMDLHPRFSLIGVTLIAFREITKLKIFNKSMG